MNIQLFNDPEVGQRRRHAALLDAIDQCRRAMTAVNAEMAGEEREMRRLLLAGIRDRLLSLREQLKALK